MAKKEKEENIPVEAKNNAVAPAAFSSRIEEYAAENNVRDIEADEVITPRIALLQSGSPQVKKSHAEYIAGAEEGDIINTGTKKVYKGDTGICFVPCFTQRVYNEWVPQDLGGGLVRRWGEDDSFKNLGTYTEEKGKWQLLEADDKGKMIVKSEIIKTADYYALMVDLETGIFSPVVIGFSGTKYKVHRKLINDISLADFIKGDGTCITPPSFARVYQLTTVPESKDGNNWFNYRWQRIHSIDEIKNNEAIWNAAAEFRKLVIEGVAKVVDDIQEEVSNHEDGRL